MSVRTSLAIAVASIATSVALLALLLPADEGEGDVPLGSTLEGRWADPDGNGVLERKPGEPLAERTELAPASEQGPVLARLAQITDPHVRDEESPARAPLLDRLAFRLNSTFRPQEALSAQVLRSTVESVNASDPDAVVVTGDLADSAQRNELRIAFHVLDGGRVEPDSGSEGYDGPQESSNPDPFFYRPDIDAPRHPGLLEAAQEPFHSPGLDAPWYAAAGNHDLLVQGEVPPTPALEELATGNELLREIDPSFELPEGVRELTPELVETTLMAGLPGQTERVPADRKRRHLGSSELVRKLRAHSDAGGSGLRLDYTFDIGAHVRGIVLDLVARTGGSDGRVAPGQAEWLAKRIKHAGRRWILVFSHQPIASAAGGQRLFDVLDRSRRVVAVISGHTHRNLIEPREGRAGGYWQISTASLADFPQQTRSIELVETARGVALRTWMLDGSSDELSDTARALAYLDVQGGRPQGAEGEPTDRNVVLYR